MARLTTNDLLPRARDLMGHATSELAAHPGDAAYLQNAAGKAWAAARLATQAVVFCKKKARPKGTAALLRALKKAADESPPHAQIREFERLLGSAYRELHLECSEDGSCNAKQTPRAIREVNTALLDVATSICRQMTNP